ncbi:MAG: hypothetical protein V4726_01145 [Verrucomicrobiota bacterium]
MSEEHDHTPPKPTTKTSAVPLKKETVRITLRPNAPGSDAPPATVPLSPPPRPSFGGAPPAPTIPLSPPPRPSVGGGAPPAPSAPTAPGAPPRPAPPVAPVGSKTIPLGAAPPRAAAPGMARPASAAPVGGTQPLPRATVAKLPSASPTAAISSAPIRTAAAHDEDTEVDDGPLNILSVVALVASLAALFLVFASVDSWPMSYGFADSTTRKADWEKDNDVAGFKLPLDYSPFDKKSGDGVISNYDSVAPKIPVTPPLE